MNWSWPSFQSTPPSREATVDGRKTEGERTIFQSTPPSREATRPADVFLRLGLISIHASLAGGDPRFPRLSTRRSPISIHASLAGGDSDPALHRAVRSEFQSTPPSREATAQAGERGRARDFNPRLPRGRRPEATGGEQAHRDFNPRLPRGRRRAGGRQSEGRGGFQSTPPSREATLVAMRAIIPLPISIHASLAGGDDTRRDQRVRSQSISIHASLAGGDDIDFTDNLIHVVFQSTPPSREATPASPPSISNSRISIHASLAGGDERNVPEQSWRQFQSTPPSREATGPATMTQARCTFQSTPPSREATVRPHVAWRGGRSYFNPRLPRGRRRLPFVRVRRRENASR